MQEEAQLPQQLQRGGREREGGITRGESVLSARPRVESREVLEEAAPARLPACPPPLADLHPAGRTGERRSCVRRCALSRGCGRTQGPGRRRGRVFCKV